MTTDIQPRLLTIDEVAVATRLGRTKVYQLIGRGTIRSVRVDGCRRVRLQDLEEFVARLGEAGDSGAA
jgi:excisionase family DNA binding protein